MPTYAEERGIKAKPAKDITEYKIRIRELEQKNKDKDKIIADQKETIEILKKSLHIFVAPHE